MKITINQFDNILNDWVRDRLIPSFKNPLYIFITSAAVATNKISIVPFVAYLSMLGIVDDTGCVDIDKLDEFMRAGFQSVPTLDLLGIRFSMKDYNSFRESI